MPFRNYMIDYHDYTIDYRDQTDPALLSVERPAPRPGQIMGVTELQPGMLIERVNEPNNSVRLVGVLAVGKKINHLPLSRDEERVIDDPRWMVVAYQFGREIMVESVALADACVLPYNSTLAWNGANYIRYPRQQAV